MESISGSLSPISEVSGSVSMPSVVPLVPFEGPYEVTPSGSIQILPIEGMRATSNVVVNPIPHNYGLITWNGSYLTVS